jgi:signal transduction histidine kinase
MQNEALRHSQIELAVARDRYFDLYDFAPVGYLTLSPDGMITEINLTGVKLLGKERKTLLQKRFTALVIPRDRDRWTQFFLSLKRLDGRNRIELALVCGDGATLQAQLDCERAKVGVGDAAIRVVLSDIWAQKQAEMRLHESEMRWQFALESHGDAMWDWDAEKDELFLTAAASELFRLPDMKSKRPISDLLARVLEEDRALVQGQIDDIIAGTTSEWLGECRLSGSGQAPRWIATRGRVMTRGAEGQPQRIVSISRDVTERKLSEAEDRRQRELVAQRGRLMLLGELASALAHEINQPLTAITGFAAACARKAAEIPEAQQLAHAIEEQAMRAGEIAWRMRGFARRQRLRRSPIALHEVIGSVAKWVRLDSTYSDVAIDVTGIASTLPPVIADRVELEQVLVNLVRNGIEAYLPDAMLHRIAIAGCAGELPGQIEVSVTDWGQGLPADMDPTNFQPFTSSKEEGLGLGLTICRSIIERHGGHLWATPNPEGGTSFHFTLPFAEQVGQPVQEEIQAVQLPLNFPGT